MNGPVIVLLLVAAVAAAADWVAVARGQRRLEHVAKPATTAALVAVALVLDPADPAMRAWFVVALVLSLAGDVALMVDRFVPGLVAFLLAHLAYVAGLLAAGPSRAGLFAAAVVVAVGVGAVGVRVVSSVRAASAELTVPVAAYLVVISLMVLAAGRSGSPLALAGAVLFYGSDSLIAWNRFVRPLAWAPVAIMVTYHAAQALLTLSLLGSS